MIPGLAQWVEDLALLWLWRRLAATAPIGPLAWEPPYAAGSSSRKGKKTKKQNKKQTKKKTVKYTTEYVKYLLCFTAQIQD